SALTMLGNPDQIDAGCHQLTASRWEIRVQNFLRNSGFGSRDNAACIPRNRQESKKPCQAAEPDPWNVRGRRIIPSEPNGLGIVAASWMGVFSTFTFATISTPSGSVVDCLWIRV